MTNVLVTGAGGPAGIAVVRALVERGEHVVAVDADPLAAGLRLAARHAVVCPADRTRSLRRRARRHREGALGRPDRVDGLRGDARARGPRARARRAGVDPEAALGSCVRRQVAVLEDRGARPPSRGPAALGGDTADTIVGEIPGPGSSSRGSGAARATCTRSTTRPSWRGRAAGSPADRADPPARSRVHARPPHRPRRTARRRGAAVAARDEGGISTKGRTFCDERLTRIAERVVAIFSLTGAANLQGFVTDDDEVVVIEVNPRFSGGLSLSLAAGADLVGEFVRGTLGMSRSVPSGCSSAPASRWCATTRSCSRRETRRQRVTLARPDGDCCSISTTLCSSRRRGCRVPGTRVAAAAEPERVEARALRAALHDICAQEGRR